MQPQVSALLESIPNVKYILAGVVAAIVVASRLSKRSSLDAIPTVGSTSWLRSWWETPKFRINASEIFQEGYDKYKSAPFKTADRYYTWIVVLGSREHLEELRKAPDHALSFEDAANDALTKIKYAFAPEASENPYHVGVVTSHITRRLASLYADIRDEVSVAFDDVLDLRGNEWKSVPGLEAIQKVVCRANNRVFVGFPLCRDPEWSDISLQFTLDAMTDSQTILRFPDFLSPFVALFMKNVTRITKRSMDILAPTIEARLKLLEERGKEWDGQPNDLLSWLLDVAPEGPERSVRLLTSRVLATNVGAMHTTSSSFAQALLLLAEHPQYIQPLREEVESVVEKEGWSKASLGKMRKIDSFLKESQRFVGIGATSMVRKAVKDYTFSDGTFIPKGTTIVAPISPVHHDDQRYENARVFDPFRFSNMRDEGGEGAKHQLTSTSLDYIPFGHGKHACPGRFFAAMQLKSILAHIVVSYDIKLEDNKPRPQTMAVGTSIVPDPFAKVMFRNRIK